MITVAGPSGARAVLVPDRTRPLVATSLRVAAGSGADPLGKSGLAHVLEHMMFSGTHRFGSGGHIKAVQSMGGFSNATTSADWTRYLHVVSPDLLAILLALETERLTDAVAAMTEEVLRSELDVVLSERAQRTENVAYGSATEILLGRLYPPESPYHRLPVGAPEDVRAMQLSDCRSFHDRHYVAPNVSLSIVGDFEPDDIRCAVESLLAVFPAPPSSQNGEQRMALPAGGSVNGDRLIVPSPFRPKVFVGVSLPPALSRDFELARFAGLFLGRGMSSRLQDELVRREGLAASVAVKTMARSADHSVGIIEIVPAAGVGAQEAIAALDRHLGVAAEVSERDLARTKAIYLASWLADDDTLLGRSDSLTLALQLTGSASSYFDEADWIASVELADLHRAVTLWQGPGPRAEVVYQP